MQSSPDVQGFKLPAVVNPKDTVCFKINVPNEPAHLQAFIGVLYDLTLWVSWQRDPAHTGIRAAQVWKKIWNDLAGQLGDCCPDCPVPIEELEYQMSVCEQLRFQDGKLQALCCGVWEDISGQGTQGIGGPGQPGPGSPLPPPGGGCQTYHAVMMGSEQWLCPPVVNAGDTVQISNVQGAWSDGAGLWYCAEGQVFFAGACTATTLDAFDPIPTVGHMALLTKIAGVYHNISDGVLFTVPGGVTNALLIFQANDSTLADNYGQITFDVTVCNNAAVSYSHTFDFTLSPSGFSLDNNTGWSPLTWGAWVPGVGWQDTAAVNGGTNIHAASISLTLPGPVQINTAQFNFTVTKGSFLAGTSNQMNIVGDGAIGHASETQPDGPNSLAITPGLFTVTGFQIFIHDAYYTSGADGSGAITSLTVTGPGSDPF